MKQKITIVLPITLLLAALLGMASLPARATPRLRPLQQGSAPPAVGETGQVSLSGVIDAGSSITITLNRTYSDPVVVAFVNTNNGTQSVDVRVRNVTSSSFNLFKQEPDNGSHGNETLSYIVMEKGHYWLDGGLEIEAGTLDTASVHRSGVAYSGVAVTFDAAFGATPAVLHTLNTYNNGDFMSTAAYAVSSSGFTVQQEAAGSGSAATTETIGWIAFATGSGSHNGQAFEIGRASDGTADGVQGGTPHVITFSSFASAPDVVVKGNSYADWDGYWARGAGTYNATTQSVWAEEDQVGDPERSHWDETFAWAAFASDTVLQANCFVETNGDGVTDYGSDDASALRLAIANATGGDTIKVAGTCAGGVAQGGTTQVLYLDKNLTITGGYTTTNWITPDPARYHTTLDAQDLGRVVRITNGNNITLQNLLMVNGNITGNGAGILVDSSTLTIENSWISNHLASGNGGGLYATGAAVVTVRDSMIANNNAVFGSGLHNDGGTMTIESSTVYNNDNFYHDDRGHGVRNENGQMTILNSTVSDNVGAGIENVQNISAASATLVISYTTIVGNGGHGILQTAGSPPQATVALVGTIIAENGNGSTIFDCQTDVGDGGVFDVTGGYNLDSDGTCVTDGVNNNVTSATPLLTGIQDNGGPATGAGGAPWTHALLTGSPALDAIPGGVIGCGTSVAADERGRTRPFNGSCDRGAFEYTNDRCFVSVNEDGTTDYFSTDASALHNAIANADSGDTLKVAGTCAGVATQGGTDQVAYVDKDLTITGGYTITNWLAAPDGDMYPTILDAQDSGRVVYVTNNATLNLSHLTLRNGLVSGVIEEGGAVFLDNGTTTTISNTIIQDSQINLLGGGIYNDGDLTLTNSTVSGNQVNNLGGGIYNGGTLTVTACTFDGNNAGQNGGGLMNGGTLLIQQSTFISNTAVYNGGGLLDNGTTVGSNNTFSGNQAGDNGGGIYASSASTQISYSTISGNSATNDGGGVWDNDSLQLYGVIIANSTSGGDCFSYDIAAVQDAGYNLIEDGSCLSAGTSLSGDPRLGPLADNGGETQTHALWNGSPALVQIPAGSCAAAADQRGTSRPQFGLCDMGAYENTTDFPPFAVDDVYTITEDTTLVVAAPGVLDNDSESNGQSLSASLQADVSHGILDFNSDGSFVYTPTLNYSGSDSFTYLLSDGSQTDTAQVTLNVIGINDPPVATDNAYTAGEYVLVTGDVINDDTGSGVDSDPDGSSLTANLDTDVATGNLTLNGDGSFTYLPPLGWTGSVTFTYWLSDSIGASIFSSLDFDGDNDYLAMPSMNNGNAVTFEAWVRPDEIRPTVQQIYNGGGPPKMVIEINGSGAGGTWEGRVYDGVGTVGQIIGPAAVPGEWTHVAYVYDYSSNHAELFINGVSAGTTTAPSPITHTSIRTLGAISTGTVEFLNGRLGQVRLWNTARTEAQIQANMNQTVDPADPNLLAYYRMDDNGYGSTTAVDSANGYDATLVNMDPATAWVPPGASGTATVTITVTPARCWVDRTGDAYADHGSWDSSAVQAAIDQASAGDTLKIAGTCNGVQTVNTETQVAYVSKNLAISGGYTYTNWLAPADSQLYSTVLDAAAGGRVIFTGNTYNVTLSGLTLQNGNDQQGGGIFARGNYTITNCVIQYNTSSGHPSLGGGGIFASSGSQMLIEGTTIAHNQSTKPGGGAYFRTSDVTIVKSSIYENSTNSEGGGLYFYDGNGRVDRTTIYSNTAINQGGGIYLGNTSQVFVINSTLSYNQAASGGGIANNASLTLSYDTMYYNVATTGGALYNGSPANSLHVKTTILAGAGDDCGGNPIFSDNYNISDDASCNLSAGQDQPSTLPRLAPLADNGGATWTHALYPASPAIDAIPTAACTVAIDQRDENRDDWGCDVGAFEMKFGDGDTVVKDVSGGNTYTFGPTLAKVEVVNDGGCLTKLSIQRVESNHPAAATTNLQTGRYWSITPTGCSSGLTLIVTLPFTFTATGSEADCRYTGSGWDCGPDADNATASTGPVAMPDIVTRQNVTQLSDWVVGTWDPTAVTLAGFTATPAGAGVLVAWETVGEVDVLGFHVYRADAPGAEPARLNAALIPAHPQGGTGGPTYTYVDETTTPGVTYAYWLEVVDAGGGTTRYGPVSATLPPPATYHLYLPLVLSGVEGLVVRE